ncbi:ATP phosphoribosyltransferase regulatory subunit [Blastomonas sp. CCH15-G10]|uniref:ATP phosphoribosyltransferase regulatory subunit n=1 Tax=Blastomonas sp. CCH15-G10 TaxID=1768746 RepID=UPI00082583F2|nr:ATP phosphoribosyltransferase regulatory subunit [Blastomonas sp. CCH15-G10]
MSEANPDILPAGLADLLPPRAEQAAWLTRNAMQVFAAHGYDRVSPPLVEYERSLATRMQGTGRQHLFRMVDPSSMRTLAIRSDITVQVGRVATTLMASAPRPLRLSYAGQVLRIASDQLAPERERLQIGAELIGHDNIAAAQEVVRIAIEALVQAGATGITVDLTLPDLVDTLASSAFPLPPGMIGAVRRELDMKDAGGLTALGADAYLPLLYAMGPFEAAIDALAAIDAGGALASRIRALREIAAALPDTVTVTLDPTERHGFEYQSWFGFSLYADGCPGALGRGGTYAIPNGKGGEEVATGFSLYPDALLDLGGVGEAAGAGKLFLPLGHDRGTAARLRAIGWRTVAAIMAQRKDAALGCTHRLMGQDTVAI